MKVRDGGFLPGRKYWVIWWTWTRPSRACCASTWSLRTWCLSCRRKTNECRTKTGRNSFVFETKIRFKSLNGMRRKLSEYISQIVYDLVYNFVVRSDLSLQIMIHWIGPNCFFQLDTMKSWKRKVQIYPPTEIPLNFQSQWPDSYLENIILSNYLIIRF